MANALETELNEIEKKFLELCLKVVSDSELDLYDFCYNPASGLLQVFIEDKSTGTALIEDCVKVDRGFDPYVEEEWLPANFTLEVSSPGVYRNLVTVKHFESALNQPITLNLKKRFEEVVGLETCPKKFKGQKKVKVRLISQDESALTVRFDKVNYTLPFETIKNANLDTD